MASQGPNSGGTFANDSSYGTTAWTSPSNAAASEDSYATCTLGSFNSSQYLKATNFGFSIPSGATIDGIVVEVELKASSSFLINDSSVKIVKGGTIGGTDKKRSPAVFWPAVDTYITYGGASDLWGLTWTDSDINGSTFGIVFSAHVDTGKASITASIDHIRITVHYTTGGGGGSSQTALLVAGN